MHVSSIAALGFSKKGLPVTEKDKWEYSPKLSKYSIAKYESEMQVWRGIAEGLDAVIVNPSIIMGLGWGQKGSRAIFDLVEKGNKLYPLGSVGIVDVSDVVRIMIDLMKSDVTAERYILNAQNISNQELLTKISELMNKPAPSIKATPMMLSIAWRLSKVVSLFNGKKPAITAESAKAANSKLHYDNSKIKAKLGYTFKPLEQTLAEVCHAYYIK